jgi:hypothetical protein
VREIKNMNKTIEFTIYGTHRGKQINPLPKLKMTGKQHWMPKAQEYTKWKGWVVAAYFDAKFPNAVIDCRDYGEAHDLMAGKPIVLDKDQKARMDIKIYWSNNVHGDPENIFGSIADALFKNDKNLAGSFDWEFSKNGLARVEVKITK